MKKSALFMSMVVGFFIMSANVCKAELPDENRQLMCKGLISAGEKVAGKDISAQDMIDYVDIKSEVSSPIPGFTREDLAVRPIKEERSSKFRLVCAYSEDKDISPAWSEVMSQEKFVVFLKQSKPVLIVRTDIPMTSTWKGLVLLREALHIKTFFEGVKETEDLAYNQAIDDYFANRLVNDRLIKIGGQKYAKLLKKESKRLAKSNETGPQKGLYKKDLEIIFGKSLSEVEDTEREDAFFKHAKLKSIEDNVDPKLLYSTSIDYFYKKIKS